jgi:hypothetical protein
VEELRCVGKEKKNDFCEGMKEEKFFLHWVGNQGTGEAYWVRKENIKMRKN